MTVVASTSPIHTIYSCQLSLFIESYQRHAGLDVRSLAGGRNNPRANLLKPFLFLHSYRSVPGVFIRVDKPVHRWVALLKLQVKRVRKKQLAELRKSVVNMAIARRKSRFGVNVKVPIGHTRSPRPIAKDRRTVQLDPGIGKDVNEREMQDRMQIVVI